MRFRTVLVATFAAAKVFSASAEDTNAPAVIEDLFAPPLPAAANAPASASTLEVKGYQVAGNTVLPPDNFGVLSNYTGTNIDFARLRLGLVKLQQRYRDLGYSTISVTLPPQKLTNGIVQVKVIEGRLSDIKISGNRHFSDANIRRALPSLSTNVLLNSKWFQPELDQANASRDRQIYPVIGPGPDPGTSELTLNVKDRLPLHGRVEINDKSQPDTPLLRLDTAVEYDNLWQREHQVGVDYNFSPQEYKPPGSVHGFYDQPLITSYSGFYRLPLDFDSGEREALEQQPATFGYDETTHQFNLPPATGHPDLAFYGSRSVSATPLRYGPLAVVFTNQLIGVGSRSVDQSFTYNNNAGAKFNDPLPVWAGIRSSFSLGVDYKAYEAPSYSTNLTLVDLYDIDPLGNRFLVTNRTVALPANARAALNYVPLSFGWSAARPDPWGSFAVSYSQSIFLDALASARTNFQVVAAAPDAGGNYTTINAGLAREQKLWDGWSALLNASGQWASAPLINNEQFALGGTTGVRGYQQGEIYGDDGWRAMFDLRAPPVEIGNFPTQGGYVPAQLRCSWFMDYGQAILIDRPISRTATADFLYSEWGTGVGFFLTVGEHFDARLTLAWALLDTPTTGAGSAQAYFSIGAQF